MVGDSWMDFLYKIGGSSRNQCFDENAYSLFFFSCFRQEA